MMKYIFYMQINIEVFYKLILSFWVYATRHIQNKKFANLPISPIRHGGEADFLPAIKREDFL